MVQTWIDDVFGETHDGITDLENMEDNFLAIKSFFSGTSEPTFTKVAGMPWYDTNQKILKIRNSVDNGWVGVMAGNESFKIWVYLNAITAQEGWDVDGTKTDMVIGLKGSSRYTAGATSAGSWTLPDYDPIVVAAHGHNHNHMWHDNQGAQTDHTFNSGGSPIDEANVVSGVSSTRYGVQAAISSQDPDEKTSLADAYTDLDATADGAINETPEHTDSGTWAIEAAIGIMVFPDITP